MIGGAGTREEPFELSDLWVFERCVSLPVEAARWRMKARLKAAGESQQRLKQLNVDGARAAAAGAKSDHSGGKSGSTQSGPGAASGVGPAGPGGTKQRTRTRSRGART